MPGSETDLLLSYEDRQKNLDAIYNYVRESRTKIDQFPDALPIIQSFESWYQGLGWYDRAIDIGKTTDEARRRKAALNEVLERKIPDDWVPADRPQTPPPEEVPLVDQIPLQYKVAAVGVGVLGIGWLSARILEAVVKLRR